MSGREPGPVVAGARRVWQHQRVLWWIFAMNLLLAFLGTLPAGLRISSVLDRSLAAERLYRGFDLSVFIELMGNPDGRVPGQFPTSLLFALVFFGFMLFLTGGLLEAYRGDRVLHADEFFRACGAYFWRWVRLLIFLLIGLVPLGFLANAVQRWSDRLAADAPQEMLGFWVELGGAVVLLFVLMAVRLWFDMAQVRAVAESETQMRRTLLRAFRATFGNFGSLFWVYLRISLLAWIGLAAGAWVWVKWVRPESVGISFLLGQAVLLIWLGTRLWQRASETVWYQRHFPAPAAPQDGLPA